MYVVWIILFSSVNYVIPADNIPWHNRRYLISRQKLSRLRHKHQDGNRAWSRPYLYLHRFAGDYCKVETGENGICRSIHNCPYAKTLLHEKRYPRICSFDGKTPVVCCKVDNIRKSATALKPGTISAQKCREYYPYKQRFLLVGATVRSLAREFPHMAVIGFGEENNIQWLCGGSLISQTFVLTAAHCLKSSEFGDAKWVRLGDLDLYNDTDQADPQQFAIKRRIPYPGYKRPARYNDIGLIELNKQVRRTLYVGMACLDTERHHNEKSMIATGWGRTQFSGEFSSFLLKINLDIVPLDTCRPYYKGAKAALPNGILDDYQICAGGGPEQDTCQGDSGGPLQVRNRAKFSTVKVYNIVGITSFGKACGLSKSPGIYTRVYNYLSWIERIVWPSS